MKFLTLKHIDGSNLRLNPSMIVSINKSANDSYTTITLINGVTFTDIIDPPETIMEAIEWIL